jgi:tetratricopeptide (TPR) repeat protein
MRLNLPHFPLPLLFCFSILSPFPARVAAQQTPPSAQTPDSSALPSTVPASTGDAAEPKQETTGPPPSPLIEGISLFRARDFDAAAAKLTTATGSTPMVSPKAYAWLARTDLHLHKVEDSEIAACKAIELDPNLPVAQSALAEVYFRQAKFGEAEGILRKLASTNQADARACLSLARLYWATANNKGAKACIDLAHKMDPDDPDIYRDWVGTLPWKERLEEWKKRLAQGKFDNDEHEREGLTAAISVLENEEKQPQHSCRLTSKTLPAETSLAPLVIDAKRLRGYGLTVKVNDTSSKLLVDTGASGILINSKIAEKAGVTKIADQHIGGIGDRGASSGYVGFAKKLQVGNLVFEDCYVDVVDKKNSLGEDGLVGTDVFADFLVDLDFPNTKLRLSELPPFPDQSAATPGLQLGQTGSITLHNRWIPPQFASYEKVYRFGHMLLIPGFINDSPPKLFLVDTGAWDNIITPEGAKGATKLHTDSDIIVKGLSGKVEKVYSTGEVTLAFGNFRQHRRDMVAFDMTHLSNNVGTEICGTLGFAMLYLLEIKIDYRDHLVEFTYDPNRFH